MKKLAQSAALALVFGVLGVFAPTLPAFAAKDHVLWDAWYTVTVGGGGKASRFEYYNDRVELKKGRLYYLNKAWKREEDFINQEQLGVYSENDDAITPLFYNFHSVYRTTETIIDGNANSGTLSVRIKKAGSELPVVKKQLSAGLFFSQDFPLWIARRLSTLKPGTQLSFATVLEDSVDSGFPTTLGKVELKAPDDIARSTKTQKLVVHYRDMDTIWWIKPTGEAVRIEMPSQMTTVERVPAEKARHFLDAPAAE